MGKKDFMKDCGKRMKNKGIPDDEISGRCKIEFKKHQREVASTSEFGISKLRFKTNNKILQSILFIIFLVILIGIIVGMIRVIG